MRGFIFPRLINCETGLRFSSAIRIATVPGQNQNLGGGLIAADPENLFNPWSIPVSGSNAERRFTLIFQQSMQPLAGLYYFRR